MRAKLQRYLLELRGGTIMGERYRKVFPYGLIQYSLFFIAFFEFYAFAYQIEFNREHIEKPFLSKDS